jgi:hypothetical protein
MIFLETPDPSLLSAAEIDRALEVAKNWGGWSYEEAELIARALIQTAGKALVPVRADT